MVLGAAAKGIGATLNSSPQARTDILRAGGHTGLVDAYLAIEFALLSVMAAAFGVATVLRLHGGRGRGAGRGHAGRPGQPDPLGGGRGGAGPWAASRC